ncbi:hypothetical protein GCM10022198_02270 [Klugiella xanthotipulae]|nr:LytR C-terminal domain-containing protein [Klugiella xanthotipulae]
MARNGNDKHLVSSRGSATSSGHRSNSINVLQSDEDPFEKPQMGKRVGVHRSASRRGTKWIRFMWAALATIVLAVGGILYLAIGEGNLNLSIPGSTAQPTAVEETPAADAVVSPDTSITILNGTSDITLGDETSAFITAGSLGEVTYSGSNTTEDVEISAVFYVNAADEGLARGLAEKLGGLQYYLSADYSEFGSQLIVLLGSDFQVPTQ